MVLCVMLGNWKEVIQLQDHCLQSLNQPVVHCILQAPVQMHVVIMQDIDAVWLSS